MLVEEDGHDVTEKYRSGTTLMTYLRQRVTVECSAAGCRDVWKWTGPAWRESRNFVSPSSLFETEKNCFNY